MPKVSVVMAVYNGEVTIEQAITSILHQDEVDWEMIIVSDGSTDRTVEIVQTFLNDGRIMLVENEQNQGSGYSRNLAITLAKSPWIAVQDADDISLPTRLSKQLAYAKGHPNVDVVSCQVMEFGIWGGPELGSWPLSPVDIRERYLSDKMPVAHCGALIRRESIEKAGGYDPDCRRAQDFALFRRMVDPEFSAVQDVLLLYRTERPLPLKYAISSGRYGRLARIKTRTKSPRILAKVQTFPSSIPTDLRSLITWGRRRINERS